MPWDKNAYPPNWDTEIRPRILARALELARSLNLGDGQTPCCEWCHVLNGAPLPSGAVYRKGPRKGRPFPVILTTAHLGAPYPDGRPGNKHDKFDCRDENLKMLCQACHLKYDLPDHLRHAAETRSWKRHRAEVQAGQLGLPLDT